MVLITGATGFIGGLLVDKLYQNNIDKIRCFVRNHSERENKLKEYKKIEICYGDIGDRVALKKAMEDVDIVVHIVHIRFSSLIVDLCNELKIKKVILIHTTGMFSKYQEYVREYIEIEKEVLKKVQVPYVIFRPTMIYGSIEDRNIHKVIQYIQKNRIVPLIGGGRALFQPIYGRDLSQMIYISIIRDDIANKAYNASGKTILSYKEMVNIIARLLKRRIMTVYVSIYIVNIAYLLYKILKRITGKVLIVSKEQVDRLLEDKVFSNEEVKTDLKIELTSFEEGIRNEINEMNF